MADDKTISWEESGVIIHKVFKQFKTREQILKFNQLCMKREKNLIHRKNPLISFPTTSLVLPIPSNPPLPFYHSTTKLILEVNSICLINNNNSCHSLQMPWMIMARGSDTAGSIQLQHPLTGTRVAAISPNLDLMQFRPLLLAQGYDFNYSANSHVRKVIVLCSSSTCLEVLVFYKEGILGKLTVRVPESQDEDEDEKEVEEEVRYRWKKLDLDSSNFNFDYLDDVIEFKEMYCGIDRKGRLFELNINTMKVKFIMVSKPIVGHDRQVPGRRRRRLVVDTTSEEQELHLVVREHTKEVRIKIYKFNSRDEKWEEIKHFGKDKVLFVGVKHCFYVETKYIPGFNKGNCLVFAANCFPLCRNATDAYDKKLFGSENSIKVGSYRIDRKNSFSLLSSQFSSLIWPPPTWFPLTGTFFDVHYGVPFSQY